MFYLKNQFYKFISLMVVFSLVFALFSNVHATVYDTDEEAAKALPYVYSYQNNGIYQENSRVLITDNHELIKGIYYSYGSVGYSMHFEDLEEFFFINGCQNEETKLKLCGELLTQIYQNEYNDCTSDFLQLLASLPDAENEFCAYYLFDETNEIIGFTYDITENNLLSVSDTEEENNILESDEETSSLLGTSNGVYYNGHPNLSSFSVVNPTDYGFPNKSIPTAWNLASTDNQIEIAKVKFTYVSVNNSSSTHVSFGGANAKITGITDCAYANSNLIGKTVSLFHCMTGSSDSAPYDKNDSDSDSNLYIAANADNVCYMHFYVRSVDSINHRVYIEIRTDYIDADYNRSNTSVQAVAGGIYYDYNTDSYASIEKGGIATYIDSDIIEKDFNLKAFNFEGVKYGIYKENDKVNPVGIFLLDAEGNPSPGSLRLDANTNYFYHEISGNSYYQADDGYYLFNSGEHANTLQDVLNKTFTDSVKPYFLYFHKQSENSDCIKENSLYHLRGASYIMKDNGGNFSHFMVGFEKDNDTNEYLKPILRDNSVNAFITDDNGDMTYTFSYSGDSSNITNYYHNVVYENGTYTITFTKDNPLLVFYGEYYLYEIEAPNGYLMDEDCNKNGHHIVINDETKVYEQICMEKPVYYEPQLHIQKTDYETDLTTPLGNGSLQNAVFSIQYYDGYYNKSQLSDLEPLKTWYCVTDENGAIDFQNSNLSKEYSSDDFYITDNKRVIPLGTIKIKEIQAPAGYIDIDKMKAPNPICINGSVYSGTNEIILEIHYNTDTKQIEIHSDGMSLHSDIDISVRNKIKRGDLSFVKSDYKSGNPMRSIAFIITSKTTGESHIIVTDDNGYATTKSKSTQYVSGNLYEQSHLKNTNDNDQYLEKLTSPDIIQNKLLPSGIWFYGTNDRSKWNNEAISDDCGALPYDSYTIKEIISNGNKITQMVIDDDYVFDIQHDGDAILSAITDMPNPEFSTSSMDMKSKNHYSLPETDTIIVDTVSYKYFRYDTEYTLKGVLVAKNDCMTKDGVSYKAGEPLVDGDGNYIRSNVSFKTAKKGSSFYNSNAAGEIDLIYHFNSNNLQGIDGVFFTFLCSGLDEEPIIISEDGKPDYAASNVINCGLIDENAFYIEDCDIQNTNETISFMSIITDAWTSAYHINVDKTSKNTIITDTIYLSNLVENDEYKIISTLVDGQTGEIINDTFGNPCTVTTNNIIYHEDESTKNMKVDVTLPGFDSTQYLGKHVVVYEELLWNNYTYIKDMDIHNTRESVYFPCIAKTMATSEENNKMVPLKDCIVLKDEVCYEGLAPGKKYTIIGTLHYKDENGQEQVLVNQNNAPISAMTEFTAEESSGTIEVAFSIDLNEIALNDYNSFPKEIVVFEDLYYEDKLLYSHADIEDTEQTVYFPTLSTSLKDSVSDSQFMKAFEGEMRITDYVSYHNLSEGERYTIIGKLINKTTMAPLMEDGKEVVTHKSFVAKAEDGMVDVTFRFNADHIPELKNATSDTGELQIVAYEYLYEAFDTNKAVLIQSLDNYTDLYEDVNLLSVHANIENVEQTITTVSGQTTLVNAKNNEHYINREDEVVLNDTITYHNLLVGKEYEVTGTLYTSLPEDQMKEQGIVEDDEGNPCMALRDKNGKEITGTTTFIATQPSGSVDVSFRFHCSDINMIQDINHITAFEEMRETQTGYDVFTHADIMDGNQTVYLLDIKTEAVEQTSGTHNAEANKQVTVLDKLSYSNLIVGQEYTIKGCVMLKDTAEPLKIKDEYVTSEVTFIAETVSGEIPVEFSFNASNLTNKSIVIFEDVFTNGIHIGSHSDLNDEKQTINFPPENTPPKKTGDWLPIKILCSIFSGSVLLSGLIFYKKRRYKITDRGDGYFKIR